MAQHPPLSVRVWGDFACFTRPEMKAERVSYEVMTPSAARGILEAIFWKPEIQWQVRRIHVLRPIRHHSILRTEVNERASVQAARGWAKTGVGGYDVKSDHTQRHTLALRDVAYVIDADVVLRSHATEDVPKYRDQFRRRVARGQYHHAPCLGCREFATHFGPVVDGETALPLSDELGRMLFDLRYGRDGRGEPVFFQARLEQGVLHVPPHLYDSLAVEATP